MSLGALKAIDGDPEARIFNKEDLALVTDACGDSPGPLSQEFGGIDEVIMVVVDKVAVRTVLNPLSKIKGRARVGTPCWRLRIDIGDAKPLVPLVDATMANARMSKLFLSIDANWRAFVAVVSEPSGQKQVLSTHRQKQPVVAFETWEGMPA